MIGTDLWAETSGLRFPTNGTAKCGPTWLYLNSYLVWFQHPAFHMDPRWPDIQRESHSCIIWANSSIVKKTVWIHVSSCGAQTSVTATVGAFLMTQLFNLKINSPCHCELDSFFNESYREYIDSRFTGNLLIYIVVGHQTVTMLHLIILNWTRFIEFKVM